jgi:hypothetical protein
LWCIQPITSVRSARLCVRSSEVHASHLQSGLRSSVCA